MTAAHDERAVLPLAEIRVSDKGGIRTVKVRGEVDLSNLDDLARAVMEIPNHMLGVLLDLSKTSYIDSSTVQLLYRLRSRVNRRRQLLSVVSPDGTPVRRVLEVTGFPTRREPLWASAPEAAAAIRAAVEEGELG
jgi:stage II sporulation protein AA (anti-sigma F factor antagonist)